MASASWSPTSGDGAGVGRGRSLTFAQNPMTRRAPTTHGHRRLRRAAGPGSGGGVFSTVAGPATIVGAGSGGGVPGNIFVGWASISASWVGVSGRGVGACEDGVRTGEGVGVAGHSSGGASGRGRAATASSACSISPALA